MHRLDLTFCRKLGGEWRELFLSDPHMHIMVTAGCSAAGPTHRQTLMISFKSACLHEAVKSVVLVVHLYLTPHQGRLRVFRGVTKERQEITILGSDKSRAY